MAVNASGIFQSRSIGFALGMVLMKFFRVHGNRVRFAYTPFGQDGKGFRGSVQIHRGGEAVAGRRQVAPCALTRSSTFQLNQAPSFTKSEWRVFSFISSLPGHTPLWLVKSFLARVIR